MNRKPSRKEKIAVINALLSGKMQLKELQPITFLTFTAYTNEPGILYNQQGERFTEEEVNLLIENTKQTTSLYWLEVGTKDSK